MEQAVVNKEESQRFYGDSLRILKESGYPFMLGGAFAIREYTGVYRDTKDLDIFCKASDYPRMLKVLEGHGYRVEMYDVRWLAKAHKDGYFIDFIFNTVNNICTVDDTWFENTTEAEVFGERVKIMGPEELLFCKIYVQNRERYDGADVNHLILKYGHKIDWKRLFTRLDQHWHLLLSQFLNFQFVYPSDRDILPKWLFDEMMQRAHEQYELPTPKEKVCLGPIIDQTQYQTDIKEWGYKVVTIMTI